jgi:hypothetical protein
MGVRIMTKQALIVFAIAAAALCGCDGSDQYSTGNQRSIDADISAAQNTGPTLDNQNAEQISGQPGMSVPFKSAY